MRYLLLHTASWDPAVIRDALAAEMVETRRCAARQELVTDERPAVLVLDPDAREHWSLELLTRLFTDGVSLIALGRPGEDDIPSDLPHELLSAFVPAPAGGRQLLVALRSAYRETVARRAAARARLHSAARTNEVTELAQISVQLTTEKNYRTLLGLILEQARRLSQSDAGSLYVVEPTPEGVKHLRFMLSQNESRPDIRFAEFTIPIDNSSLAGYAATRAAPLVLDDVYDPPIGAAYTFNRSFDERHGYRSKSMLVIPMQNHLGDVIGVLQLINRKRDPGVRLDTPEDTDRHVAPYSQHMVKIIKALAGQAAVSIENSQLYQSIERLFEGFVRAAVTAIEQRDPATSGHSERVAVMTVRLAETVDRTADGQYRSVTFNREQLRELRYAGLLHDFGKVGVREQVLLKAKKLYDPAFALIQQRQAFAVRTAQWRYEKARADLLEHHGLTEFRRHEAQLVERYEREVAALAQFLQVVTECNEPTILPQEDFDELRCFAERCYEGIEGDRLPLLTENEFRFLTICQGSLDAQERLEIESHVTHTYGFLRNIPWTKELERVPEFAHGHHEKLNGEGYPLGVTGVAIPIQTRMMTIADIYDALTAADRPYKRAVSPHRALDIIDGEVKAGMLDGELFRLFVEARVFEGAVNSER